MTGMPTTAINESALILCTVLVLLTPFAAAGLALINTGLGRSHSAAHVMLSSLCVFAVAAGIFVVCGFAWQGYSDLPGHSLLIGGKPWNWIGAQPFLLIHFPVEN